MTRPVYAQPLDVGIGDRWWDLAPLRLDRAVPLRTAQPPRVPGLYTLHADGELVYVGQSTNLRVRVGTHRRHARERVDRILVAWMAFEDVREAREVEGMIASAMNRHRPPWNRTGYGRGTRAADIVEEWFRARDARPES